MQQASIDYDLFSRDIARSCAGQKQADLCDFFCAPVSADRLAFEQAVVRGALS